MSKTTKSATPAATVTRQAIKTAVGTKNVAAPAPVKGKAPVKKKAASKNDRWQDRISEANADDLFFGDSIRSAKGESRWSYLSKPDMGFKGKGNGKGKKKEDEPTHKITVLFDEADPEYQQMFADLLEFENAYRVQIGQDEVEAPSCIKVDDESGRPGITFRKKARKNEDTGEWIPVEVVDASRQPTRTAVFNGSIVRVIFTPAGWSSSFGVGAKPYLNAVQLLKASAGSGSRAGMFAVEEEYVSDDGELEAEDGVEAELTEGGDDSDLI